MAPDHIDDIERIRSRLERRHDATTAAAEAARAMSRTYEFHGGTVRVTIDGRFRIGELYVSERVLRSPEVEQLLVVAVNEAMAAAQAEFTEQLKSQLDPETADLIGAMEELIGGMRQDSDGRGRADR